MVFPAKDMLSSSGRADGKDEPFIVPIAMPLMAGPSSLSIIMLHASQTPDSISQMTYAGAIVTAWSSPEWCFSSPRSSCVCWEKKGQSPWNG